MQHRSIPLIGLIFCLLLALPAAAQKPKTARAARAPLPTADQIIDRFNAAAGYDQACPKLTSMKMTGRVMAFGQSLGTFAAYQFGGTRTRFEMKLPDHEMIMLDDGRKAWVKETGQDWIAGDSASPLSSNNFCIDFKSRELFPTRAVGGIVNIDGQRAYRVTFTRRPGHSVVTYFDVETHFLRRMEIVTTTKGKRDVGRVDFADYRAVGEMLMPYRWSLVESGTVVEMAVDEYQFNVPLDETLFKRPAG